MALVAESNQPDKQVVKSREDCQKGNFEMFENGNSVDSVTKCSDYATITVLFEEGEPRFFSFFCWWIRHWH